MSLTQTVTESLSTCNVGEIMDSIVTSPLIVQKTNKFSEVIGEFRDEPVEKATDWAAGYLPAFKLDLQLDLEKPSSNKGRKLLDYGCGKGAVAMCLLDQLGVETVHGCDVEPECLKTACERAEGKCASGHCFRGYLISQDDGRVEGLPEGVLDGAMCNFVISMLKTRQEQVALLRNVLGSLAPGAPFVMLVNNPATIGTRFASIQVGEKGKVYNPGQIVRVQMFNIETGEMYFETRDRWWPIQHFIDICIEAGFMEVRAQERTTCGISDEVLDSFGLCTDSLEIESKVPAVLAVRGVTPSSEAHHQVKKQKLDQLPDTSLSN